MGFLSGKRALIVGLATDRSIAWGIAKAMHREGAELAFSHIERMADRVVPLAKEVGSDITFEMDVATDENIARGFAHLKTRWEHFDILVHAVAFASREALTGAFIDATTRDGFRVAHDISSYSLTALARESLPFMNGPGRRHRGAELPGRGALPARLQRHGIWPRPASRPTCASWRPIWGRWASASMPSRRARSRPCRPPVSRACARCCRMSRAVSPIKRNVTIEDVGNAAAFLCSDLAAGITGEVTYVDGGFNSVGMSFPADAEG